MSTVQRTDEGRADIEYEGFEVITADVVALLSGVNFSAVEKVIAALHVIQEFSEEEAENLIDLNAVPLKRVRREDPDHAGRAFATMTFCEDLVACGRFRSYQNLLPRIDKTFSR